MKKKSMNLITAVAVLVVLSGVYVGVKTYVAKQEEKENAEEEEEKTQVFSISSEDVHSIKFVIDKKEVTFEKNNDEWVKSDERDFPVDQDKLIEAIGSLNNVEADRVLDNVTDTTEYGLDDPTNTITITDKDGKETVLHVGMENASTSQYYVENGEDESKIYVVADSVFQPFMKTLYDYAKAGTFPVIDSSTVSNVTVDENDDSYTLTKDNNTGLWNIKDQDGAEKADSAKVSSLTSSIASIAYGSFVNYNCKDLSEYGLDKPYGTITINYQEEVEEKSDPTEDGDASEENSTDEQDTTEDKKDISTMDSTEDKDDASAVDSTEEDTSATDSTEEDTSVTDSSDTQTRMVNREMTILVGDQSDDDGRYVMVNNSKEIYTISNDTLSVFLGKTKEDFWDMTVSYLSVNNLESLQAEYQGETHVIDVSRETSEDNSGDDSSTTSTTTLSYQLDGTEMDDSTPFTTFYNKLINMTGQKRLTEKYENNNKSDFDVELEDVDGEKTKIDYYQYDTNFYAAVVGQKVYLVNKMTVKELIDSYKTLVGQTDSESSDENSDLVSEENATDEDSNSADNTDNTNGVDVD
ncbi:DUF4340 domain-containing protein [Blautia ammoniilytica]|uniref:DUF4340 domain-containing protein n=1 Tax=Blautia ammoniilytica TaxID=2981782 RepID=A0ABT2TVU8_9FIRM|nr:DUF4340 domain-containing protein [Blautia ammoniilytica]MCU6766339.1 DUF4340 domain-containing protein [Blautia ammoniilytica]SCI54332.1 Uncharacterised protein [uncultured Blautia sp.]